MTVGVAKAAGVLTVLACTPPSGEYGAHPAVLYGAYLSQADRVFAIGGVQALGAMAFGLLGEAPVDMLVGAGNAYVTEAKRQLGGSGSICWPVPRRLPSSPMRPPSRNGWPPTCSARLSTAPIPRPR